MVAHAGLSYGALLIGVTVNAALYGVSAVQVFTYFNAYKSHDDSKWIALVVLVILSLDTFSTICESLYAYNALVSDFGQPSELLQSNWEFFILPAITAITSTLVQGFLAWRIQVLTRNRWVVGLIGVVAFVSLLGGIGSTIATDRVRTFFYFRQFEPVVVVWLGSAVLGNLLITFVMIKALRAHKTGFADTDTVIRKVTVLVANTGLITAAWTLVDLVLYVVYANGTHFAINLSLGRLYSNSLMLTLNARKKPAQDGNFAVIQFSARGKA
ncbi:hypothetical protein CONPUDRAFT_100794 [Coniophora puteana RWD-64-598 SS2]|uniref:DUF6534 domain-containing protein n=1 Tax=Coniophora puteana (strain RWD-64-598) TaxID=741705 RepID=A0A5M3MZL4_CONPW|nr:uncharacterized protein CONPUDRAFT_100794 [Coniophora puteana RWD-64-598 SS2]EIW84590.1 hypothetical protein CONPUDRAFT_100794 [Coniophora puteana RWD-64-598 SS2]